MCIYTSSNIHLNDCGRICDFKIFHVGDVFMPAKRCNGYLNIILCCTYFRKYSPLYVYTERKLQRTVDKWQAENQFILRHEPKILHA